MSYFIAYFLFLSKNTLMKIFDEKDKIRRILEEFRRIDEFYDAFKVEFETAVISLMKKNNGDFKRDANFDELLNVHVKTILGTTQTVLDKDLNYPEYRKQEDLQAIQSYYDKAVPLAENLELSDEIYQKTKELIFKYYPNIIDLSGEGFRLLDLNLKLFNLEFVASYNKN